MVNPQVKPDRGLVHEALLYRTPGGFAQQIRAFVAGAGTADEPVLAVLPPASLKLAQNALAAEANAVRWESMWELGRNPSCLLAVYQGWIDSHPGPVRVIGEPVWPGRSYAEIVECLRHEALINHELAAAPVCALCPYDAERLDAAALSGAEITHPSLIDDAGRRRRSEGYGEPLEVATGSRWPQAAPAEPVTEHTFAGDLRSLRHAVARDPIAGTLGRERRADLVFAVSEAASNAVKHGDGTCTARLWSDGDAVITEVVTRSAMPDALAGRRRPDWDAAGGRGLWLINQVCDLVELRSDTEATVLRMHLHERAA